MKGVILRSIDRLKMLRLRQRKSALMQRLSKGSEPLKLIVKRKRTSLI